MELATKPRNSVPIKQFASLLARYLRPQMGLVIVVSVLLLANIGLQLVNPLVLRYFIDEALAGSPIRSLVMAAVLFTVIALVQQTVNVVATYTSGKVGWTATNRLRADLARHCLSLDMSFHNNRTPGEMIERIDGDSTQLGEFFSKFVIQIFGSFILLIGILLMLFREEWRAGLALTAFTVAILVTLVMLRNAAVGRFRDVREASAQTFGFIEERLSGREDIRTSAAKQYVARRFYEYLRTYFQKNLKASLIISVVLNTTWFSFAVGNAVSLGVGAYLFLNGSITIGTVYLIFHFTNMLGQPIERFTQELNNLQKAAGSAVRILDLFETKKTMLDGAGIELPRRALSVRFEDVSFAYNREDAVLSDVSFEVGPGRVLGLLGRTGSGKTTMTRLLFRLYDPDRGRVLLDGRDIREARISDIRRHIAMVTQDVRLFHGTVRDNLTFFDHSIPDRRLLDVIDDLGLADWYDNLPDGLATQLQPEGGGLSAGEAQLLAFTRVFLRDPGVVILDEASSRLDPSTEQHIEQAIDRLVEDRTVIMIAHRLGSVQRCDEIMIVEQGRIVEHGDRKQLAEAPESRFHRLLQIGLDEALA